MYPRLKDVAQLAKVDQSTASVVLNRKAKADKVSPQTRTRIFSAAEELGYHPNAAAVALTAKRSGHIGFLLSDAIAGGWSNLYYAQYLSGIDRACRRRGYGLNISLYNLSNVDTFVFPVKVRQRSVDGVLLAGYVESALVRRFLEFGVPVISMGQDIDLGETIPTIASDHVAGILKAFQYVAKLGHTRIMFCYRPHAHGQEKVEQIAKQVASSSDVAHCRIAFHKTNTDYDSGRSILTHWLGLPVEERPTVILASDQALITLLQGLAEKGVRCPEHVSLISVCNTLLCEIGVPKLTAISQGLEKLGELAVDMLIDHLEDGKELCPHDSRNNNPCELIVRASCDVPPRSSLGIRQ